MTIRKLLAFSLLASSLFPISAVAQCKDQVCQDLQSILYNSITDFRGYREKLVAAPGLSIGGEKIPCKNGAWANDVSMYACSGEVSSYLAEAWYTKTLSALGVLQPTWYFRINSQPGGHLVDGGPPDCVVDATGGPYAGDCPFHLQLAKLNNGTSKIYLCMTSLSSPYLSAAPPTSQAQPGVPIVDNSYDKMCQSLKAVLEARLPALSVIRLTIGNSGGEASNHTQKLPGASECVVQPATSPRTDEVSTEYVCYWPETSASDADARYRDLVSRLQVLVPSNWPSRQKDAFEELSGQKVGAWVATAPGGKQQISVYVSGSSVGLHIETWGNPLTAQIPRR
ncbi:MAG TPA: hypothetical protein VMI32_06215 [Candidatus Solibacter sp.]|nr:hypothetical protein [Candidatus Solibacter sp.]